ncbi:MAG: hypothetical protein WCV80_01970 [Candidatus Paceibacterota bacterium]|jgi:hypothetical protein
MTKSQKIFLIIIAATVYLNIGWAIGSYWVSLEGTVPQTTFGKFLSGPINVLAGEKAAIEAVNHSMWIFCYSFIWFIDFIWLSVTWIIYFILWFIFWGGLARLMGAV